MSTHEAEYTARLEALTVRIEREAEEQRRASAARSEQRAQAARSGELGPDWQEVQRRVDAGQTTVAAVFTGEDDTPAARRLVAASQQRLTQLAAELPVEVQDELTAAEAEYARLGRGPVPPRLVTDDGGQSPA